MSVSKDELKELIRSGLKEVIAENDRARASTVPAQNHIDHTCSCPDCYCGVLDRMNKTSDYKCSDCGLPLGDATMAEAIKACPNCGSTSRPKKVER
jgi:DNA-directed RNA polymerase subunit RPC12/RpoP